MSVRDWLSAEVAIFLQLVGLYMATRHDRTAEDMRFGVKVFIAFSAFVILVLACLIAGKRWL